MHKAMNLSFCIVQAIHLHLSVQNILTMHEWRSCQLDWNLKVPDAGMGNSISGLTAPKLLTIQSSVHFADDCVRGRTFLFMTIYNFNISIFMLPPPSSLATPLGVEVMVSICVRMYYRRLRLNSMLD